MTEKEEWKSATCYECGEGYESKEDYDDMHIGSVGERYHEGCCPACWSINEPEEKETAIQKKQRLENALPASIGLKYKTTRTMITAWLRGEIELTASDHGENARLRDVLKEVMLWVDNWTVPFKEDDEWPQTEAKVKEALKERRE